MKTLLKINRKMVSPNFKNDLFLMIKKRKFLIGVYLIIIIIKTKKSISKISFIFENGLTSWKLLNDSMRWQSGIKKWLRQRK